MFQYLMRIQQAFERPILDHIVDPGPARRPTREVSRGPLPRFKQERWALLEEPSPRWDIEGGSFTEDREPFDPRSFPWYPRGLGTADQPTDRTLVGGPDPAKLDGATRDALRAI